MPDADRVSVQLSVDALFGLLTLPVQVGDLTLRMFISGSPVSGIAPQRWPDLLAQEHLVWSIPARPVRFIPWITSASPAPPFPGCRSGAVSGLPGFESTESWASTSSSSFLRPAFICPPNPMIPSCSPSNCLV